MQQWAVTLCSYLENSAPQHGELVQTPQPPPHLRLCIPNGLPGGADAALCGPAQRKSFLFYSRDCFTTQGREKKVAFGSSYS